MRRKTPLRRSARLTRKTAVRKRGLTKAGKPSARYLKQLFSLIVRHRDGYTCRKCGKHRDEATIHCSHIYSQGAHPAMRYDLDNAIALCAREHLYWWHREPIGAYEWLKATMPAPLLARLAESAKAGPRKQDPAEVLAYLQAEATRLGVPFTPSRYQPPSRRKLQRT